MERIVDRSSIGSNDCKILSCGFHLKVGVWISVGIYRVDARGKNNEIAACRDLDAGKVPFGKLRRVVGEKVAVEVYRSWIRIVDFNPIFARSIAILYPDLVAGHDFVQNEREKDVREARRIIGIAALRQLNGITEVVRVAVG